MNNVGCVYGIIVTLFFVGVALLTLLVGWTDVPGATRALRADNLTPVQVGGIGWFACGKGDWYATKFTAKNLHGDIVTGTVCSGLLLKGTTVRFN